MNEHAPSRTAEEANLRFPGTPVRTCAGKVMSHGLRFRYLSFLILIAALFLPPVCRAQSSADGNSDDNAGVNAAGYKIRQSIEAGYRSNWINGDQSTYDTFVNLGQGVRLFDYTLDMRSVDHNGLLFDSLSFTNFGYGGDPDTVSRLRMEKNKLYDFRVLFRRSKVFWDWNLMANPLNPASSNPAVPVTTSPHFMDTVRRMEDYDLTLLPQSRVRFRIGYSRNRYTGPGGYTTNLPDDGAGNVAQLNELFNTTTNSYRAGVDFRVLARTTISYDQFLTYFKQDSSMADLALQNGTTPFVLPNGQPVDLGLPIDTANGTPCAAPILTAPNVVNPSCDATLSYSQVGRPRTSAPFERVRFQSNYFKNFETSASIGYSRSDNVIPDFNEQAFGSTARTIQRGSTTGGPAEAKRISVNADWSGVYAVTDKLRILDEFRFDDWRTPGAWNYNETALFTTGSGLLGPISAIPGTCVTIPSTCPNHNSSSPADISTGLFSSFLAQRHKTNTFQLQYDLNKKVSGRIGYLYTQRTIAFDSQQFLTQEVFYPNNAARGDCADPTACTAGPGGTLTFSGPSADNDTARNIQGINEEALLLGLTLRPIDALRISGDFSLGYNDFAFTRTSPRHVEVYKIHATYKPRTWINFDTAFDLHENSDNVATVNDTEHSRTYSFLTTLLPNARLTFDIGYNYSSIYSAANVCYFYGFAPPIPPTVACPTDPADFNSLGAFATYSSEQHFGYFDVMWKPIKRVTVSLGYAGTFVRGSEVLTNGSVVEPPLNPLQPAGTLAFNYQKPYATLILDLYRGLSYRVSWNYYGFNGKGPSPNNIPGLAFAPNPIAGAPNAFTAEDFNGSTATFALRYAF